MSDLYRLPEGHRPFEQEANRMSLDAKNTIYWNGNKLKTETKLPFIAKAVGWVVSVSAIAAAGATMVQAFIAYDQWQNPKIISPAAAAFSATTPKVPAEKRATE